MISIVPEPPKATATRQPILALRGVTKSFGWVRALDNIDFDIFPREVVAVVGDNAAGKSVLAKTIAGVYQPDDGVIYWDGEPTSINSPGAAHDLGIATVFQELALCDNLSIVENLFLGRELSTGGAMAVNQMEQVSKQVLAELGAKLPPVQTSVAHLSAGQRQITAIARSLLGSPRIVVMDEPTSSLSVAQTAEVLNLIEHLRDLGYGVMLISHTLTDVQAVADRLVVMRHGRINGEALMADVTYEDIIAAITGVPNELTRATRERGPLAPPAKLDEVNSQLPFPERLTQGIPSQTWQDGTYGRS
ncbi:MAG: ATP-binding cassette domain-containing protein [Propionibacteriaceae bacterium]|jgi:ABC-type sugar transport system ATPase subunit|nr:ATP-binding cassette domain-containing protein [Propionibacteriaceae bacterium]